MNEEILVERLFQCLVTGDRPGSRAIVQDAMEGGMSAEELAQEGYWPVLQMIGQLYRADQLSTLAHHYATRLLRVLIDQGQASYVQRKPRNRKILMFSGDAEPDELAGQLVADLAEADGYEVYFGGGGVANDEILEEVGKQRPDILLMFSSGAPDAPNIRLMIDTIRSIDSCPEMQIVVGGGIFNRAEGLAEEIGADLWAREPRELLQRLDSESARRATTEQRTVGRNRRAGASQAA